MWIQHFKFFSRWRQKLWTPWGQMFYHTKLSPSQNMYELSWYLPQNKGFLLQTQVRRAGCGFLVWAIRICMSPVRYCRLVIDRGLALITLQPSCRRCRCRNPIENYAPPMLLAPVHPCLLSRCYLFNSTVFFLLWLWVWWKYLLRISHWLFNILFSCAMCAQFPKD